MNYTKSTAVGSPLNFLGWGAQRAPAKSYERTRVDNLHAFDKRRNNPAGSDVRLEGFQPGGDTSKFVQDKLNSRNMFTGAGSVQAANPNTYNQSNIPPASDYTTNDFAMTQMELGESGYAPGYIAENQAAFAGTSNLQGTSAPTSTVGAAPQSSSQNNFSNNAAYQIHQMMMGSNPMAGGFFNQVGSLLGG